MAVVAPPGELAAIREKLCAGERLDDDDAATLYDSNDLLALAELADLARRARGGDDRVLLAEDASETLQDRGPGLVRELVRLRELEDETGAIGTVTVVERPGATGSETLRALALARLLLDNVANVRVAGSLPLMQLALHFGANEVGISGHDVEDVERFVRAAGRSPVRMVAA